MSFCPDLDAVILPSSPTIGGVPVCPIDSTRADRCELSSSRAVYEDLVFVTSARTIQSLRIRENRRAPSRHLIAPGA